MPGKNGKLRKGKKFEIPEYLHNMGLNAYEFSAGRMANFSDSPDYAKFRDNVKKYDLAMSIHAPYYISLTSETPETYEKSIERLAKVYAWAVWVGATRIVVHPGSYGKNRAFSTLLKMIVEAIQRARLLADEMYPKFKGRFDQITLCPETMGKHGQLGTAEEVISICKEFKGGSVLPCVDFGHLYARHLGTRVGEKLYLKTFQLIESELGPNVLDSLHIHYSKIQFTDRGEKMHVPNKSSEWGPNIAPLFKIIKEGCLSPTIINESPELESDAKYLMDRWNSFHLHS